MKLRTAFAAGMAVIGIAAVAGGPADAASSSGPACPAREELFVSRMPDDMMVSIPNKFFTPDDEIPKGVGMFTDPRIDGGLALIHKIRDAKGEVVGFGSQLETMHADEQGKLALDWETSWTVILPGRGNIFLHEVERPVALFNAIQRAKKEPQPWHGKIEHRTTAGPREDGRGVIVGGTGEFVNCTGSFIEVDLFDRTDPANPMGIGGSIELRLRFGS